MKLSTTLIFFLLLVSFCFLTNKQEYERYLNSINPILWPLLDRSLKTDQKIAKIENSINKILLIETKNLFFWIEILKKQKKLEISVEKKFKNVIEETEHFKNLVQINFGKYVSIGNDETACQIFLNENKRKKFENLKSEIASFLSEYVFYRKRLLLGQLLPNGHFEIPKKQLIFKNDVHEISEEILSQLGSFLICLEDMKKKEQKHDQEILKAENPLKTLEIDNLEARKNKKEEILIIKQRVSKSHLGLFARFWNWLKEVLGYTQEESQKTLEPSNPINLNPETHQQIKVENKSEFRKNSGLFSGSSSLKIFIDELKSEASKNLADYFENFQNLVKLIESTPMKLARVFNNILMRHSMDSDFDGNSFNVQLEGFYEYVSKFNYIENQKDKERQFSLYPGFDSAFDNIVHVLRENTFFSLENDGINDDDLKKADDFILVIYDSFLKKLTKLDENLAVNSLRYFWRKYKNFRCKTQMNNKQISVSLQNEFLTADSNFNSIRSYAIIYEILMYLPEGQSLNSKEVSSKAIDQFLAFSKQMTGPMFELGAVSKIMYLDPIGKDSLITEYYNVLFGMIDRYLIYIELAKDDGSSKDEISKLGNFEQLIRSKGFGIDSFPVGFDMYLEMMFEENFKDVRKYYIALKVHNFWAANNDLLLEKITFRKIESGNLLEKNDEFLNGENLVGFKSFLSEILVSKKVITNIEEVNESIAGHFSGLTLLRSDVANLFPVLSKLLNNDRLSLSQKII